MICQGFLSRIFAKSNVVRYSVNVTFAAYLQPGVLRAEQYLHWHCVLLDAGRGRQLIGLFQDFSTISLTMGRKEYIIVLFSAVSGSSSDEKR